MFNYGQRSYIMGILNVTPDSFSDGGQYYDVEKAVSRAQEMAAAGADIIDVGGESTRPGAAEVTAEEEIARIRPVVKELVDKVSVPVSVDTYKAEVAAEVLELGADIINDVRGLRGDEELAGVVADYQVSVVIMHNARLTERGEQDIIVSIKEFWRESIKLAEQAGINREKIILDPGIGFGISSQTSQEIIRRLSELKDMGYPLLLGTSRKSMLGDILEVPAEERVEGTVATTVMGIRQGIDIFRVHDVRANQQAAKVTDAIWRE